MKYIATTAELLHRLRGVPEHFYVYLEMDEGVIGTEFHNDRMYLQSCEDRDISIQVWELRRDIGTLPMNMPLRISFGNAGAKLYDVEIYDNHEFVVLLPDIMDPEIYFSERVLSDDEIAEEMAA